MKTKYPHLRRVADELVLKLEAGEQISFQVESAAHDIPVRKLRDAVATRLLNATVKPTKPELHGDKLGDEVIDWAALKQEHQHKFEVQEHKNTVAKERSIVFKDGPILLVFFGDQHIGNKGTDIKRMFKELIMAVQTPNTYVFMMGDVVDNFIVSKLLAKNFTAAVGIDEQWKLARHYIEIAGPRLLGAVAGNHGLWTQMLAGIDYEKEIVPRGVFYDTDQLDLRVQVDNAEFNLILRHQWRGRSELNDSHGLEKGVRMNYPDADIVVGAHTHPGAQVREFVHNERPKLAIQVGTYKMYDDFAKSKGFKPHDRSTGAGVVLYPDGSFHGSRNLLKLYGLMHILDDRNEEDSAD